MPSWNFIGYLCESDMQLFQCAGGSHLKLLPQSLLEKYITYLRHRSASSWSIWKAAGTIRNLKIIVSSLYIVGYCTVYRVHGNFFLTRRQSRLLEIDHELSKHRKFRIPNLRNLICLRIWTNILFFNEQVYKKYNKSKFLS